MKIENEFIPYKQALALKELGFNEHCFRGWYLDESLYYHPDSDIVLDNPTFSQAFRWFRENYRLDGKPEYFLNDWYCYIINDMKEEDTSRRLFTEFPSHEEAELECLKKLIEIVKQKK